MGDGVIMVSKNDIKSISKSVNDYFSKNKTYPKSVKVGNVIYTIQEATYLMSRFVANPNTDYSKKNVKGATAPTGDRVNRRVVKSVYVDMCKRLNQFIVQNGKLPNYVTIDGKQKCSIILFMFMLSKIILNNFPASILFNSNDLSGNVQSNRKFGHATQSGCDNRGQNNGYYCGCHSLQEVFRNLTGKVVSQSTIAGWAGTTSSGTGHAGLETAVAMFNKTYDSNLKCEWKNFSDLSWDGLKKILNSDNQDCVIHNLYRNQWGHYEVINGISGSVVNVQNSLGSKCTSSCYCGYVENRSTSEFKSYINGISQKSILVITNGG